MAVASGGAVELIQPSLGRGAEWNDLLTDALGAAAGIAMAAWKEAGVERPRLRRFWAAVATALVIVIGWPVAEALLAYAVRAQRYPDLLSAASVPDRYFLRLRSSIAEPRWLPEPWARADDRKSLQLRIAGDRWPGIALIEPVADWSDYERLTVDLTNPGGEPISLVLRIHDRRHDNRPDDRFNARVELAAGTRRRFEFRLEQIAAGPSMRRLDLTDVAGVILYAADGAAVAGRTIYVTRMFLD